MLATSFSSACALPKAASMRCTSSAEMKHMGGLREDQPQIQRRLQPAAGEMMEGSGRSRVLPGHYRRADMGEEVRGVVGGAVFYGSAADGRALFSHWPVGLRRRSGALVLYSFFGAAMAAVRSLGANTIYRR